MPKRDRRLIATITGSRGEWGYLRPVLRLIEQDPALDYALIVTNMHLLPEFGMSVREIEADGLRIDARVYMAYDGYTPVTMAKSLGSLLVELPGILERIAPDVILIAGDRGEQLVAAIAGAHMNIPVAHIQAGELSGNVDGMTRHAIARYAHIHFAANRDAAERLRRTGEEEFRIFETGAPQLDELVNGDFAPPDELVRIFGISLEKPLILVVQHPVTEEFGDAGAQLRTTLAVVCDLGFPTIVVFPNNDAGSEEARHAIERYRRPSIRIERNLPRRMHLGLMRLARVMVGNSSSGLIEAPVFKLPAVNIGSRQRGRVRGDNVIDVPCEPVAIKAAIVWAMSEEFRATLNGSDGNPYRGDGRVANRIVDILRGLEVNERLLKKQIAY